MRESVVAQNPSQANDLRLEAFRASSKGAQLATTQYVRCNSTCAADVYFQARLQHNKGQLLTLSRRDIEAQATAQIIEMALVSDVPIVPALALYRSNPPALVDHWHQEGSLFLEVDALRL